MRIPIETGDDWRKFRDTVRLYDHWGDSESRSLRTKAEQLRPGETEIWMTDSEIKDLVDFLVRSDRDWFYVWRILWTETPDGSEIWSEIDDMWTSINR